MKRSLFGIAQLLFTLAVFAQDIDFNLKDGFVAEGYDVVSYFQGKAEKGSKKLTYDYMSYKLKFASEQNLLSFKQNPDKYLPQYGGWCAYAMGAKAEKVKIDPKTYEIREGKLYLFYNAWGVNTLDMWLDEGADSLKEKADKNWTELIKDQ